VRIKKLSVNFFCGAFVLALLLSASVTTVLLYKLTNSMSAVLCCLSFCVFVLLCAICFVALIRRKLTLFSELLCGMLDDMLSGDRKPTQMAEEESLFYKITYRLDRLYEVMRENRRSVAKERADLQELISDISHQVKTPISNVKMINSTLIEQEVPPQKQKEFLSACAAQIEKLDFLIQSMIKTSRLETGVISLDRKKQFIFDTLASALGGILLNAEKKQIDVQVNCPEQLAVPHDRKWTSEALFNILDNAVKYTPEKGKITVTVDCWELYVKISITDTGRGIPERNQAAVFQRFYREDAVHDAEGIGIGLYLAREIITMQGGYIKLTSSPGCGSCFAVFLPRD